MKIIKIISTTVGSGISWYLGNIDGFLIALLMCITVDYATGLIKAFIKKRISSCAGYKGILKKICILLLVGICNLLDVYVFNFGGVLRCVCVSYYIANESISITENLSAIGVKIPKKIKDVLKQLESEESNGKTS